jgi:catechol-2,3-dioxygenase
MPGSAFDRRHFLGSAAATAAFFAMHDLASLAAQPGAVASLTAQPGATASSSAQAAAPDAVKRPRLLSMELRAGASLEAMKAFYGKTLDLGVSGKGDRFTVEAGETMITFVSATDADTAPDTAGGRPPFYHFAFNIPENKIVQALEWQKARTPMLAIPEANRAAGYPPEVVDYPHWNAHSIFFLDPAGNVIEYIARHDLNNGDKHPFGWTDILYASEIGLVVDDVPAATGMVKELAAVSPYKGESDAFTAMGDEYGLLLLMKRGRVVDFTGNQTNGVRVYPTSVTVRGAKAGKHQLAAYPYQLVIEDRCTCA